MEKYNKHDKTVPKCKLIISSKIFKNKYTHKNVVLGSLLKFAMDQRTRSSSKK